MDSTKRLDAYLVDMRMVSSRTRATVLVKEGKVSVNGSIVFLPSKHVRMTDVVTLLEQEIPWVSRSALKLLAALDSWNISVENRTALDVGSSTGGFTQVLLKRGVAHVFSVDVGTQQLHESLRGNSHISLYEGLHIRDLDSALFGDIVPTLTVIDVSFISLEHVLPKIKEITHHEMEVVALVKPQFEVGKTDVKKGIVSNPVLHTAVCEKIARCARALGFTVLDLIPSPILGGDGNKEFLLHLTLKK